MLKLVLSKRLGRGPWWRGVHWAQAGSGQGGWAGALAEERSRALTHQKECTRSSRIWSRRRGEVPGGGKVAHLRKEVHSLKPDPVKVAGWDLAGGKG